MKDRDLARALERPPGPARTAAVAAWFQSLFESIGDPPVLVGGAAVELFTDGSYVTGDLDFVGAVPRPVARELAELGFRRQGRHWIHEREQLFIELPASALEPDEQPVRVEMEGESILVISPEALLADRLAAWKFWRSETDAFNALRLMQSKRIELRPRVAARLARELEVDDERRRLARFARRLAGRTPSEEEMRRWLRGERR